MADLSAMPGAPRLNPLQRAWLRELGMEKIWLRQESGQPADATPARGPLTVPASPSSRQVQPAPAAAPTAVRDAGGVPPGASSREQDTRSVSAGPAGPAGVAMPQARANGPAPAADTPVASPGKIAAPSRPVRPASPVAPSAKDPAAPAQPAPTPEALAAMDMETLRGCVAACTACGLCRGRRQAVFGMGPAPEQVRWLVVGEAPGEQEDRQGLPFVGRSGQLLDAMLAAVGMSRERDVYIANVIKCRPPGNRNPKPEEIAACSPYLMRQIALLKPERILVLGRFAAQTLLGTDAAIAGLRGRVHILKTRGRDIPVVVSYHPAYLLRSPAEKARAWQDLRLALNL